MTTDAELAALLVRVDWTGLSLSAKVSWRRDFAALQREVRVRAAHRGGTPPRRSRRRTPAIADLELGILLRCERLSGEESLMVMDLTELRLNPPESADPGAFTPREAAGPSLISRIPGEILRRAAKISASVMVTALAAGLRLAAGVRRLSAPRTLISGTGGTMPAAPRPQPAASSEVMSVPGHVLDLLYQSWPVAPCVRAELHQWADPGAMAGSALAGWDAAGVGGAGAPAPPHPRFDKGAYPGDQGLAARRGPDQGPRIPARLPPALRGSTFEPQPRDDDFRIVPSPGVIVTEQDDDDVDADEIF